MQENKELWSVSDIMKRYNISRMTIHRRVKEGTLTPVNMAPALRRQHRLMFKQREVLAAFGEPINQAA